MNPANHFITLLKPLIFVSKYVTSNIATCTIYITSDVVYINR